MNGNGRWGQDESGRLLHQAGLEGEYLEVSRLAEELARAEAGQPAGGAEPGSGRHPGDEAELASLLETADRVRAALSEASAGDRFLRFHADSRERVVTRGSGRAALAEAATPARSPLPWPRRMRGRMATMAAAAAVLIATVWFVSTLPATAPGPELVRTEPVPTAADPIVAARPTEAAETTAATEATQAPDPASPNLTNLSVDQQLGILQVAVGRLEERVNAGETVDQTLLGVLTATTDGLTEQIETNVSEIEPGHVVSFQLATSGPHGSTELLSQASVAPGDEAVLEAAQSSAEEGLVVAASYLSEQPPALPTATPTASPAAAPTATPTASPTASPAAAPTATPTASPTATPTTTPTASPTATPEGGDGNPPAAGN